MRNVTGSCLFTLAQPRFTSTILRMFEGAVVLKTTSMSEMESRAVSPDANKLACDSLIGRNAFGACAVGAGALAKEILFPAYQRRADHCR